MRLSLSAPVDTPDGEAAWGEDVRVQPGEDTCGHRAPSLGKTQGVQLKLEEEKAVLRKI